MKVDGRERGLRLLEDIWEENKIIIERKNYKKGKMMWLNVVIPISQT